jgi:hypothetical protein
MTMPDQLYNWHLMVLDFFHTHPHVFWAVTIASLTVAIITAAHKE